MKVPRAAAHRRPFQNLPAHAWTNLAAAGLMVYYVAQVVLNVAWGNLFGGLGIDFAAFWSAGDVANRHGYAAVYDLQLLAQTERALFPARASSAGHFQVVPVPYLPLFVVPFQLLALLRPPVAAFIWIMIGFLGSIAYLWSLAARAGSGRVEPRLLLLTAVSAPVFLNAFTGQVSLLLMVCVGEFLLAAIRGRSLVAGVWLGGLLLKPQCLILAVPALLIQRNWKILLGLLKGGVSILVASWILAGPDAFAGLARLWLGYASGLPTNDPQLMMNWRMIGMLVRQIAGEHAALVIVIVGMVATAAAALAVRLQPVGKDTSRAVLASLVLFSATAIVAWHSHVHMAMIVLPPLLMLAQRQREHLGDTVAWWVLFPAALLVLRIVLASAMRLAEFDAGVYSLLDFLAGIGLFSVNLYLVGWGIRQLNRRPATSAEAA